MSDTQDTLQKHAQRRRDFLKKSGSMAVTAPAVALLLQAGIKPAYAAGYGGVGGATTIAPGPTTSIFGTTTAFITT